MLADCLRTYLTVDGHALRAFFVVTTTILKGHPSLPEFQRTREENLYEY